MGERRQAAGGWGWGRRGAVPAGARHPLAEQQAATGAGADRVEVSPQHHVTLGAS